MLGVRVRVWVWVWVKVRVRVRLDRRANPAITWGDVTMLLANVRDMVKHLG